MKHSIEHSLDRSSARRLELRRRHRLPVRLHVLGRRGLLVHAGPGGVLLPDLRYRAKPGVHGAVHHRRDEAPISAGSTSRTTLIIAVRRRHHRRRGPRLVQRQAGPAAGRRDRAHRRPAVGVDLRAPRPRRQARHARRHPHRRRAARRGRARPTTSSSSRATCCTASRCRCSASSRTRSPAASITGWFKPTDDRHVRHPVRGDLRHRPRRDAGARIASRRRSSTRRGWRRRQPRRRATHRGRRELQEPPMATQSRRPPRTSTPRTTTQELVPTRTCWSTDHKIICMQYLFTGMVMALIGGFSRTCSACSSRFPGMTVPGWGVVIAAPVQRADHEPRRDHDLLGRDARADRRLRELPDPADDRRDDMVFPRINRLSYQIFLLSVVVLIASFFVQGGGFGGAWTAYPPLSAKPEYNLTPIGSTMWVARGRARVRRVPARRHQLRHHGDELARARA